MMMVVSYTAATWKTSASTHFSGPWGQVARLTLSAEIHYERNWKTLSLEFDDRVGLPNSASVINFSRQRRCQDMMWVLEYRARKSALR